MIAVSPDDQIARYADMLAALGAEPRLRIVRLLLSAQPEGLVVGEIGAELGIQYLSRSASFHAGQGLIGGNRWTGSSAATCRLGKAITLLTAGFPFSA